MNQVNPSAGSSLRNLISAFASAAFTENWKYPIFSSLPSRLGPKAPSTLTATAERFSLR
jgi:hypothetical protein